MVQNIYYIKFALQFVDLQILKTKKIVSGLFGRHEDFSQGTLEECYVVHNSKAVVVKSDDFSAPDKETIKQLIHDVIEKLRT